MTARVNSGAMFFLSSSSCSRVLPQAVSDTTMNKSTGPPCTILIITVCTWSVVHCFRGILCTYFHLLSTFNYIIMPKGGATLPCLVAGHCTAAVALCKPIEANIQRTYVLFSTPFSPPPPVMILHVPLDNHWEVHGATASQRNILFCFVFIASALSQQDDNFVSFGYSKSFGFN